MYPVFEKQAPGTFTESILMDVVELLLDSTMQSKRQCAEWKMKVFIKEKNLGSVQGSLMTVCRKRLSFRVCVDLLQAWTRCVGLN